MLEVGDKAPDFTLLDQDGEEVSLSSFAGAPVLVYFYPKDDTSGCTTQACGIRDQWSEFEAAGAVVLGISPDPVDSHRSFASKHDLPHRLLADTEKDVITSYGAWGTKSMYGREYEGVIRSSVLVDADGTVAAVWPKIQPKKHADTVLRALHEL